MPIFKKSIVNDIQEIVTNTLKLKSKSITLEISKDDHEGDVCTSIACQLSSQHKLNPQELATSIAKKLESNEYIDKAKAEKNGFINITLSPKAFLEHYESLGKPKTQNPNKSWKFLEVISANPTGYLHIGHTRNGIYTDTLGNILKRVGYSVRREYLVNDDGNQIQVLTDSFLRLWINRSNLWFESLDRTDEIPYRGMDMQECVDTLWKKYELVWIVEKNKEFKQWRCYKEVRQEVINYFLSHIKSSLTQYKIDVDFWRFESDFVNEKNINSLIKNLNHRIEHKDGALWLNIGTLKEPKYEVIIKQDGHHTYFLQDTIYHDIKLRLIGQDDEIVNILGCDHYGHVDKLMGYISARGKGEETRVKCICMQLVKLIEDGKELKMSKRDANVIFMKDLEKYMSYEEVRWYFVSQPVNTQLDIDLNKLRLKDFNNPVYYVMYAYSRISTILSKSNPASTDTKDLKFEKLNAKERQLFNLVIHFESMLEDCAEHYAPHKLTQYLFKLSQVFHSYYEETQVIGGEQDLLNTRLALLMCIRETIKEGLELMKITV